MTVPTNETKPTQEPSVQSPDSSPKTETTTPADSQATQPSGEQSSSEVPPKTDIPPATNVPDSKGGTTDGNTQALPEEYELELSLDSPLSEEDLNEIAGEASRLSLSKDDAMKLIALKESAYKSGESKVKSEYQSKIDAARKQIMADPMFQGDQAQKTFTSMSRAIETFGDEEMVNLVKSPEFGNNVVFARFLKKLGDALAPADEAQDVGIKGGSGSAGAQQDDGNDTLKQLYPAFFEDKK